MEDLYSLESLQEQMRRLEADFTRRIAEGGSDADLRDLRWRMERLRVKIDAELERPRRRRHDSAPDK